MKDCSPRRNSLLKTGLVTAATILLAGCSHSPERLPSSEPSSRDEALSRSEVRALYPELTPAQFRSKLDGADTPYRFLRSFARVYYRIFGRLRERLPTSFSAALETTGWCAGDAHPENFGTLVDDRGRASFTLIDLDDTGPCTVVSDLLRFLIAARLADPDMNSSEGMDDLLDAYFDGTEGRVKLSIPVRELLDSAAGDTDFKKSLEVEGDDGEPLTRKVDGQELARLRRTARKAFGNVTVRKATRYAKTRGGSAGIPRYRVELGDRSVLEFRTLVAPAVFFESKDAGPPASHPASRDPLFRMNETLKATAPAGRSRWFSVQKLGDDWVLISPRYRGIDTIELKRDSEGSHKNRRKILRDEAAVLGDLHARTTPAFQRTVEVLRSIRARDWERAELLLLRALGGSPAEN